MSLCRSVRLSVCRWSVCFFAIFCHFTAPAHQHATRGAVYTALFFFFLSFFCEPTVTSYKSRLKKSSNHRSCDWKVGTGNCASINSYSPNFEVGLGALVAERLARAIFVWKVASSSLAGFAGDCRFSRIHSFLLSLTGFHLHDDVWLQKVGQCSARNSSHPLLILHDIVLWTRSTVQTGKN